MTDKALDYVNGQRRNMDISAAFALGFCTGLIVMFCIVWAWVSMYAR